MNGLTEIRALIVILISVIAASAQTATTGSDGWVVLPVSEYAALKRAAAPAEPEATEPPVEATLSRIDYNLKVDGDLATGEARLNRRRDQKRLGSRRDA